MTNTQLQHPNRFTDGELRTVGIEITDGDRIRLRCRSCGASWSPNLRTRGRMPNHYWWCLNGCNCK